MKQAAASAFVVILAFNASAADWPQLQCDAAKSGFQPAESIATDRHANTTPTGGYGTETWGWTNQWLAGQPVVGGGKVVIGSLQGFVYAREEATGAEAWSVEVDGPVLNSCAIMGNRVIVATQAGTVQALALTNGAPLWTYAGARKGYAAAPTFAGDRIYIGSKDGTFHALDAATGDAVWTFAVGGSNDAGVVRTPILCSAAVLAGRVFFGAENMHAYALDAATGARLWRRALSGQSFSHGDTVGSDNEKGGCNFSAGWAVASAQNGGVAIFRTQPAYPSPWLLQTDGAFLEDATGTDWTANPLGTTNDWIVEQRAVSHRLQSNSFRRTLWALDPQTGNDKYPLPLPVVFTSGSGHAGIPPVVDDAGNHAWSILRSVYARIDGGAMVIAYGDLAKLNLFFDPAIYTNPAQGALGFRPFACTNGGDCMAVYGDVHKVSDEGEVLTGCANAILSSTWVSVGGYDLSTERTFNVRYYSSDDLGGAPLYGGAAGAVIANGRVILRDTQGIKCHAVPNP